MGLIVGVERETRRLHRVSPASYYMTETYGSRVTLVSFYANEMSDPGEQVGGREDNK